MTRRSQYSYDAHLREEDAQLFHHDPRSWTRKHVRAADDLRRDLKRHGYLEDDNDQIIDDFAEATVTLEFEADSKGSLTVPKGTPVQRLDPSRRDANHYGDTIFETDEALTVSQGSTDTVQATATAPGEPFNVGADELTHLGPGVSLSHFESVTNPSAATGGADHQLTRAAVYRTLKLVYTDLLSAADDVFNHKRKMYCELYDEELERLVASGLDVDTTGDGESDELAEHASIRLRRS
ncbi:MAG: baseplate J/gp47 family protein [Bradymonadaceae bacterium]